MSIDDLASDLLRGAKQIAKHVFKKDDARSRRRVYHKHLSGQWPIWKDGADLVSRKSELNRHFQPTTKSTAADGA